ncbi:MAG: redoxin domain-containing protein [Planctomycetota bacterium]|nr:redoxin domain-containing protein [Planctomycetota bacterium]
MKPSSLILPVATAVFAAVLSFSVLPVPAAAQSQQGGPTRSSGAKVGETAPAFTLKDASGKEHSLADYKGKIVVLEWMNEGCPVCRGVMEDGLVAKMVADSKKVDADVVFLFINSTAKDADRPEKSAKYLEKHKINGTALIDGEGTAGHLFGAKTTPHCFVIDAKGTLAYAGAFDNEKEGDANVNYVVSAVTAIKAGKTPSPAKTQSYGCGIKYKK